MSDCNPTATNLASAAARAAMLNPIGHALAAILNQRLRPSWEAEADAAPRWLWQGYVAAGKITLLTSQWKSGKTTLMAVLLARLAQAGQLAGLATFAARVAVFSEEAADDWARRCRRLGIAAGHVSLFCLSRRRQPARRLGPVWMNRARCNSPL